jgi:hypothetical protein
VNLDFSADPTFSWYVMLLLISGLVMAVLACVNSAGNSNGSRILSGLFGVGFIGYGIYLGFIFNGGTYIIFFKVFIVPVLLVVNFVRTRLAQRRA